MSQELKKFPAQIIKLGTISIFLLSLLNSPMSSEARGDNLPAADIETGQVTQEVLSGGSPEDRASKFDDVVSHMTPADGARLSNNLNHKLTKYQDRLNEDYNKLEQGTGTISQDEIVVITEVTSAVLAIGTLVAGLKAGTDWAILEYQLAKLDSESSKGLPSQTGRLIKKYLAKFFCNCEGEKLAPLPKRGFWGSVFGGLDNLKSWNQRRLYNNGIEKAKMQAEGYLKGSAFFGVVFAGSLLFDVYLSSSNPNIDVAQMGESERQGLQGEIVKARTLIDRTKNKINGMMFSDGN